MRLNHEFRPMFRLLATNEVILLVSKSQEKFKIFLSGQMSGQTKSAVTQTRARLGGVSEKPFKKFLSGQKSGQLHFSNHGAA